MPLRIETNYAKGIPQTAMAGGLRPTGLAIHWTAGGTGRKGALATIRHFQQTATTINASYHILAFWEKPNLTAMWIVTADRAAHSMNPAKAYVHSRDPAKEAVEKQRFAEVKRILGRDAYDPNAGSIAISFCGGPRDLDAALDDPEFVQSFRALIVSLKKISTIDPNPLFNHGWLQPSTRYDAGERLIPLLYPPPPPPPEDDELKWMEDATPRFGSALLKKGQPIRSSPVLTNANIVNTLTVDYVANVAFEVEGTEYVGSTRWYGYFLNKGGPVVFHSKQVAEDDTSG
jgi:hypothetical protein